MRSRTTRITCPLGDGTCDATLTITWTPPQPARGFDPPEPGEIADVRGSCPHVLGDLSDADYDALDRALADSADNQPREREYDPEADWERRLDAWEADS